MIIIGIAGGTGSGKTTVARKIVERLHTDDVALMPLDSYYNDSSHIPMPERLQVNFDEPDAFDWELLESHLQLLRQGHAIEQPTYHYATCSRTSETIHVEPCKVVVIEGILTLCKESLRNMMDLKVFVDVDADERLIRVIRRDVVERGHTANSVMDRYLRVIKPMHQQHVEPCKAYADLVVPQGGDNESAIALMQRFIERILQQ